jgi:predicted  nucleic acid-binding Zn-ribbon protein
MKFLDELVIILNILLFTILLYTFLKKTRIIEGVTTCSPEQQSVLANASLLQDNLKKGIENAKKDTKELSDSWTANESNINEKQKKTDAASEDIDEAKETKSRIPGL